MPGIVWGDTNPREIVLSFDDGPDSVFTPSLLDCLEDGGIKASFFVLGKHLRSGENRKIVSRMRGNGYDVGIHGLTHRSFFGMNRDALLLEIQTTADRLSQAAGEPAGKFTYVRPPKGQIAPWQLRWLQEWGYTVFTCDCLPGDWDHSVSDQEVFDRVLRDVRESGALVAMHDGVDVDETAGQRVARLVKKIADRLRAEDFRFLTLTEMLDKRPFGTSG